MASISLIPELLSRIFLDTLPVFEDMVPSNCNTFHTDVDLGEHRARLQPYEFMSPVVLAAVCRHWRTVATGIPHLWSFAYISIEKHGIHAGMDEETLSLWLGRSKGIPLTAICFIWPSVLTRSDFRLISSLFAPQDRFEKLYLDINFLELDAMSPMAPMKHRPLEGSLFPTLRVASIYIKLNADEIHPSVSKNLITPVARAAFQNLLAAPSLKTVKIHLHEDMNREMVVALWPSQITSPLTSLHILHPDVGALLTFAGCCPQLIDLGVCFFATTKWQLLAPPFELSSPVHLPQLRSLRWDITPEYDEEVEWDEVFTPIILDYLVAPNLKKINMYLYDCDLPTGVVSESLIRFVIRSQCDLESLGVIFYRDRALDSHGGHSTAESIASYPLPIQTTLSSWDTITVADLGNIPSAAAVAFIGVCSNLRQLKLHTTFHSTSSAFPSGVVSHLRSLEVYAGALPSQEQAHLCTIFEHFSAPFLQNLRLQSYRPSLSVLPRVLIFLERSRCQLASFDVQLDPSERKLEDPRLLEFLSSPLVSTISSLIIKDIDSDAMWTSVLELLGPSRARDDQPVLPSLQQLAFIIPDIPGKISPGSFSRAFQFRFENVGLQCGAVIRWHKGELFHQEDIDGMRLLKEGGHNMRIWPESEADGEVNYVPERLKPMWVRRLTSVEDKD